MVTVFLLSVLKTLAFWDVGGEFNKLRSKELLLQLVCCSASGLVLSCPDKLYSICNHTKFFSFQISFFSTYSKMSLKQCFHAASPLLPLCTGLQKATYWSSNYPVSENIHSPKISYYCQLLLKMCQFHAIKFIIGKWHVINYRNAFQFQ